MHRAPAAMLSVPPPKGVTINVPKDPNTLSNYNNFHTDHTDISLRIDFERRILHGHVTLNLRSLTEAETKEIILDTSFLDIADVKIDDESVDWTVGDRFEPYGSPLKIVLSTGVEKNKTVKAKIALSTTSQCTALQWLTPAQTSTKVAPYIFSQCQAIHARSIFPCQDTPDVKSTFDFHIQSSLQTLASGLPNGKEGSAASGEAVYSFKQRVPIPSYLFAIASGDISGASIGPRSSVWTSPDRLQECQWEFERDINPYIEAIEKLVFPYVWGEYNVLVLPPSFPYGGMENPIYTFATPTVVSGDRENVDVIGHELSHSWSGNLVSPVSWEHFWLNEGWTTYLERRLVAILHGEPHRAFSATIGWKALQDSMDSFGHDHEFTKLIPNLKGKDPDDAFSSVPYEKGFAFLYHLEQLVGQEKWDTFIPHYFTTFKYKSLDSYDFKACLLEFFASDRQTSQDLETIPWDQWFYSPGLPVKPKFPDNSLSEVCQELATKWLSALEGGSEFEPSAKDIEGWTANQSVVFLEAVQQFPKPLTPDLVDRMGANYGYTKSKNVEVTSRYFVVGLKARDTNIYDQACELLGQVGRMKFVKPIFKELIKCDRKLAEAMYEKNKDFYHPICRNMVYKLLYKDDNAA